MSRGKIGQNRLHNQNLFILSLIYVIKLLIVLASQLFLMLMLQKFTIFAVDKMNRNASWNINQTASYPLYKLRNSVRRCNVPLAMTSLAIHMLQGDALRRAIFSNMPVAIQRHNLKTLTMPMQMQQTRQKMSGRNLSLDFAMDNCDFVCYCGSALM